MRQLQEPGSTYPLTPGCRQGMYSTRHLHKEVSSLGRSKVFNDWE